MARFAGVDIGRSVDSTAWIVLDGCAIVAVGELPGHPGRRFHDQIKILHHHLADAAERVFADATGMGAAPVEQLQDIGLPVTAVTIGHGQYIRPGQGGLTVGKRVLAEILSVWLPELQLRCDGPAVGRLHSQMCNFIVRPGKTPKFEARQGGHDDLVLALALALLGPEIQAPRRGIYQQQQRAA